MPRYEAMAIKGERILAVGTKSDINKLVWSEVQHSETNGCFIRFTQKKTKGAETLPISETAYQLLGERGEASARVFQGLRYSSWHNLKLAQWAIKAGITKHITFHSFRHTFATEHLRHGVDIRTLQNWMGHRDIKSTMMYLKGVQSKDALAKVNAGALAAYVS